MLKQPLPNNFKPSSTQESRLSHDDSYSYLPRMTSATFPYPQRVTAEQLLNRLAKMLACVFLESSTHNICVARESLLASKPTLKTLLILTDASLGFTGTYVKNNQPTPLLLLETSPVSVPAKGMGREGSSWGSLGLAQSFQAEGESATVILGCSTVASLPISCWRGKQHCLPRRCFPSGRKPAIESRCLPSLPPSSSPLTKIAAHMHERGAFRALFHTPSIGICFCIPSTQP